MQIKFLFCLVVSLCLLFFNLDLNNFRSYASFFSHSLYSTYKTCEEFFTTKIDVLSVNTDLLLKNAELEKKILLLSEKSLIFDGLKRENTILKELLGKNLNQNDNVKILTEVSAYNIKGYRNLISIKLGVNDGVHEGQVVLDKKGIVGQVFEVSLLSSKVILLSDINHSIPVSVLKNGVQLIADGTGEIGVLKIKNIPRAANLKVGDKLISSGFGGVFTYGYSVATISEVSQDLENNIFAIAKTAAQVDRIRYVAVISDDLEKK